MCADGGAIGVPDRQAAAQAGLDPVLMAAANTSGGVLGKMVSPQNLAIAAAAVGMAGRVDPGVAPTEAAKAPATALTNSCTAE